MRRQAFSKHLDKVVVRFFTIDSISCSLIYLVYVVLKWVPIFELLNGLVSLRSNLSLNSTFLWFEKDHTLDTLHLINSACLRLANVMPITSFLTLEIPRPAFKMLYTALPFVFVLPDWCHIPELVICSPLIVLLDYAQLCVVVNVNEGKSILVFSAHDAGPILHYL